MHSYALLRFLTGMGGISCQMVCFVLAVEHVGIKVREACTGLYWGGRAQTLC